MLAALNSDSNLGSPVKSQVDQTVGQYLDQRILDARKHLETVCILKAKAEASGLLDFPRDFVRDTVYC